MLFQQMAFGQRAHRRFSGSQALQTSQTSSPDYKPVNFEGRCFTVMLTNNDTISYWLKLGVRRGIDNGDTLNLSRTFSCNSPDGSYYYDFHDEVDQEDVCVRWYTLTQVRPNDSLRFVVKLKDFINGYVSRLFYCNIRESNLSETDLCLLTQPRSLVLMKESREVESSYVVIEKDTFKTNISKPGLIVQISATH